jgi:hypothetical protein
VIGSAVCTGVTLSNPVVSGGTVNPNGSVSGPWTLSMTLTNCTGFDIAFKVQGGATAWAPLDGDPTISAGTFSIKTTNKNKVITWNVSVADQGSEAITFTVGSASTTVACDATNYLSGAWSAAYTHPITGLPTKTDYTARATISGSSCP